MEGLLSTGPTPSSFIIIMKKVTKKFIEIGFSEASEKMSFINGFILHI